MAAVVGQGRRVSCGGDVLLENQQHLLCTFLHVVHGDNSGLVLGRLAGNGNRGACVMFKMVNSVLISFAAAKISVKVFTPRITMPC